MLKDKKNKQTNKRNKKKNIGENGHAYIFFSYFGETHSSQNTHGQTKRAWYATEAYQNDTIKYLPYPNSAQNLALR